MIIINPHAGAITRHGAGDVILEHAKSLVYNEDGHTIPYDIDVRYTQRAGHATELARQAVENEYYGVIACGGDGTVNEAARGVCGSEVALGVVPLGSGNGLARHLGIPLTIPGAMKVINEDRVLLSDYATANGRPFFCTFGVGFDAEVTDKFNKLPGRGLKTTSAPSSRNISNINPKPTPLLPTTAASLSRLSSWPPAMPHNTATTPTSPPTPLSKTVCSTSQSCIKGTSSKTPSPPSTCSVASWARE